MHFSSYELHVGQGLVVQLDQQTVSGVVLGPIHDRLKFGG
jgi:hypothetical protein